jgi:hypothetical protein
MPRVAVPVTTFTRAGVVLPAVTTGDATNNHSVANDGRVGIIAKNTGATSRNVTFYTVKQVDGLTAATRVEAIPAGEEQGFGPFDPTVYGTSLNIDVAHAEVTLRAIRI